MKIVAVGSGSTVHALARSAAVAARGHAVRLVTVGPVLPVEGIEVRTRPIPTSLLEASAALRGFLADIRSFEPELLHLHYAGGRLGTAATLAGIHPLVVTVMGGDVLPEQHLGRLGYLERRATRRILKQADLILVKSDALRPAVRAFAGGGARVETVRWGVDPTVFRRDTVAARALRRRLGLGRRDRVILSPRILAPLYNQHLLMESMPRILPAVPGALLLLTEHNPEATYRQRIVDRIATLGLGDRVRLVGAVDHALMPAFYSMADVVVSIPSSDGLPQSLFEAMACGAPVVLGRLPAYREVVEDGRTAILTDLIPVSIAEAVVRVLQDKALRSSLTAAAAARVQEIALLPREVDRVVQLYTDLLAERPWRRRRASLLDALTLLWR